MNQKLTIRLEPSLAAMPGLLDRLEAYATTAKLPPLTAHRLAVVCEELAANVAMHGAGVANYVQITLDRTSCGLQLEIEDDGGAFDPLAQTAPDTTLELEGRRIGGLGIHLVRNLARDLVYERVGNLNRLTAVLDVIA